MMKYLSNLMKHKSLQIFHTLVYMNCMKVNLDKLNSFENKLSIMLYQQRHSSLQNICYMLQNLNTHHNYQYSQHICLQAWNTHPRKPKQQR